MKNKNLDCITDIQWSGKTCRRNGLKVIHAKPNQLRKTLRSLDNSYVQKKTEDPQKRTAFWNLLDPAKSRTGVLRDLLRADQTHMDLQNELCN